MKYKDKFKNFNTFSRAIRKIKRDEWPDFLTIGGHVYVQEEFDESGKNMRYTSLTEHKHIDINTSDRYGKTWLRDAEVEQYEAEYYRFNPEYYITKEEFAKLSNKVELIEHIKQVFGLDHAYEFMHDYCL